MAFIIRKREAIPADDPATLADPKEEFYAVVAGDCDADFLGPATMEELIDTIKGDSNDIDDYIFLPVACARKITLTQIVEFELTSKK